MTRPIRILELRCVRGTGGGPEKTILLGTARTDSHRFAITVCYLRDARDPIFSIDSKAASLPIDYTEIVEKHSFDPSIWRKLRTIVRERGIDIVHAHDYKTNLLAGLVARVEPVVAMSTVHGWTGHSFRERWGYYPLDKRVLSFFSKLIAVSSDVRNELIRHGAPPERVVTVLNGIDHTAFHRDRSRQQSVRSGLGLAPTDFVIGAVGRAEPQKRFDILLEAFAKLQPRHPQMRLLIVGDGSQRETLEQQARQLGLSSTCRFTGHRNDVVELHHAFDLFVQSSDYEGTPNAVLEAMALETPIVATDAGGTSEIARNGVEARIVPCGDSDALTRAIDAVIEHPDQTALRTAAARRRIETELSFETRMRAVEAIYLELFNRHQDAKAVSPVAARS